MITYDVTFYDYWNPRESRQTVRVEAMSRGIAEQMIRNDHPEIGTAIVFVSVREVQS